MGSIRVLIVEDLTMVADFMAQVIDGQQDMCVVGQAGDGYAAIERYVRLQPDVVVMDLAMPGMGGVEAIAAIRKVDPAARILVLTALGGEETAYRGLSAGALGYLLKGGRGQELLEAIRMVAAGHRHICPDVVTKLAERSGQETLSERELEVLQLIATCSTQEVARRLHLSVHGVNWHIQKILHKLGVENRTQALEKARQKGFLPLV